MTARERYRKACEDLGAVEHQADEAEARGYGDAPAGSFACLRAEDALARMSDAEERHEQAADELCRQLDIEQSRRDYAEAMAQWQAREAARPGPHRSAKTD